MRSARKISFSSLTESFSMLPRRLAVRHGIIAWSLLGLLSGGSASAADLLQVYREALVNDAQYAAARATVEAGREKLPQGRGRFAADDRCHGECRAERERIRREGSSGVVARFQFQRLESQPDPAPVPLAEHCAVRPVALVGCTGRGEFRASIAGSDPARRPGVFRCSLRRRKPEGGARRQALDRPAVGTGEEEFRGRHGDHHRYP